MSEASLKTATLTTEAGVLHLPQLEIPLTEQLIENATDVQTLDYNVYTDFISTKRVWTLSWSYLDQATYNGIRAAYNSQFTDFQFPLFSLPFYDLANIPCRMSINEKQVTNVAGGVQNVQITLRETVQLA